MGRRHHFEIGTAPTTTIVGAWQTTVIVRRDTISKQELAAAITQIGGAGLNFEGSGGAPGVGAPTHASHRGARQARDRYACQGPCPTKRWRMVLVAVHVWGIVSSMGIAGSRRCDGDFHL